MLIFLLRSRPEQSIEVGLNPGQHLGVARENLDDLTVGLFEDPNQSSYDCTPACQVSACVRCSEE